MLNRLRLRLTLLYLLAAVSLVALVGVSSYSLLYYYFMTSNDSALRYKMATTFSAIGVKPPADLVESQLSYEGHQEKGEINDPGEKTETESAEDKEDQSAKVVFSNQLAYEGELSSIFIFPLDAAGRLVINPNPFDPPMVPDQAAVISALKNGSDIRTSKLIDGSPVRILTYPITAKTGFEVLQLGKPVNDQMRLMNQFLIGLLASSGIFVLLMGLGSWWLAGRSLRPTQKAWEMQQNFIANASHELRTPLTLIRASSEVAYRQTQPDTRQQNLLQDIISECDHMSQLVEDLLLISKLDTHQLKLDIGPVAMQDLLTDVQRQFGMLAEKQGVKVSLGNTQGEMLGDRLRLRQVLLILLDNALRHTPSGGEISISSIQSNRLVRVTVQDNGTGIPATHLEHVFDRFFQVESTPGAENRGNGLGLSIAKSLVEAQNGHINISSNPGKGTSVSFSLPVAR
jgi:signal transduction histidine kinase